MFLCLLIKNHTFRRFFIYEIDENTTSSDRMGNPKAKPESGIVKFWFNKTVFGPRMFSFSISSVWVVLLVSFYTCSVRVLRCVLKFKFNSRTCTTQEEEWHGLGQMMP